MRNIWDIQILKRVFTVFFWTSSFFVCFLVVCLFVFAKAGDRRKEPREEFNRGRYSSWEEPVLGARTRALVNTITVTAKNSRVGERLVKEMGTDVGRVGRGKAQLLEVGVRSRPYWAGWYGVPNHWDPGMVLNVPASRLFTKPNPPTGQPSLPISQRHIGPHQGRRV